PRKQASGLWRMDSQADSALLEQAVNHVDLVLQRLERLQRLAEFHAGARTLCVPMILVYAVAHEQNRETLRKNGWRGGIGKDRKSLQPWQGHTHPGSAKDGAARHATDSFLGSIRHYYSPFRSKASATRLFRNCG